MAHTLTAGQQAVRELLGLQPHVSPNVLEPLHRVARGILEPERLRHAFALVALERHTERLPGRRAFIREHADEGDRVLHRQLGARPDGKMGRVCRVAHEHDVVVVPSRIAHAHEARPGGIDRVRGVRQQAVRPEPLAKERFARLDRLGQIQAIEAGVPPGCLIAFHDERRPGLVEPVAVRLKHAVLVLDDVEGVRVEVDVSAASHVPRGSAVQVLWLERCAARSRLRVLLMPNPQR